MSQTQKDRPWLFRTYAGHSTAKASNALYRSNLAKGQTGLSVAFDLPTQTGYDADDTLAKGEVGKVGVPIGHLGDMEALFDGIPLADMNTSMTINATAPWLLALYIAAAERQGAVALIVIEVFICSSGIWSNSVRISPKWQTGTPTLPTSPRARMWSLS